VAFAAELGVQVEAVGAVDLDVVVLGRCEVRRRLGADVGDIAARRGQRRTWELRAVA